MEVDKIKDAIHEAKRFINRAEKALKRFNNEKYTICLSKESATCRRASMDLTRSLAELRK